MRHSFGLLVLIATMFTLAVSFIGQVSAQPQPVGRIACGDIIEGETTPDQRRHQYILDVNAGTKLNGRVEPLGDTFNVFLFFLDSGGIEVLRINDGPAGDTEQFADLAIGSTNSLLEILGIAPNERNPSWIYTNGNFGAFTGAYMIYLGCELRDGTIINPGDNLPEPTAVVPTIIPTLSPNDPSFLGFPGLPIVDFTTGVTIPFTVGAPNVGSVSTGFEGVFGFTLDANSGDSYSFEFTRISGNINLGIAILSQDNQVIFYGGMVTGDVLSTQVTFPTDGQYTVGVFRVDLLPPDVPEATTFQITASPG